MMVPSAFAITPVPVPASVWPVDRISTTDGASAW
jgi:hypothetical protein